MRPIFLFCVMFFSGCKTVEVAVTHPTTGIHFVARMEGEQSVVSEPPPMTSRLPVPEQMYAVRYPSLNGAK